MRRTSPSKTLLSDGSGQAVPEYALLTGAVAAGVAVLVAVFHQRLGEALVTLGDSLAALVAQLG